MSAGSKRASSLRSLPQPNEFSVQCNLRIASLTADEYSLKNHSLLLHSVPLLPTSPLNTSCKVNKANKPKNDRPVTFKTQIKSSGYTAAPR